jgi:hypothetical protein
MTEIPKTCRFNSCFPRPDVKAEYTRRLLRMESGDVQMISPRIGLGLIFFFYTFSRETFL